MSLPPDDRKPTRGAVGGSLYDALRLVAELPVLGVERCGHWLRHQGRQVEALVAMPTEVVRALLQGDWRADAPGGGRERPAGADDEGREPPTVADVAPSTPERGPSASAERDGAISTAVEVDDLPIERYESLAATHVVDRLAQLTTDELRTVRSFESTHRARRRVLHRIDELLALT